jgi:hypothetical protein
MNWILLIEKTELTNLFEKNLIEVCSFEKDFMKQFRSTVKDATKLRLAGMIAEAKSVEDIIEIYHETQKKYAKYFTITECDLVDVEHSLSGTSVADF